MGAWLCVLEVKTLSIRQGTSGPVSVRRQAEELPLFLACHGNVSAKYPSLSSFVILWLRFVFAFLFFMLFLYSLCTLRSSSAHQSWIALLMSYVSSNSERSHLKFLKSFLSLLSSLDCACALPRSSLQLMYFLLSLAVFSLVCGYAGAAALERGSGSSRPHPGSWRGGGEP